MLLTHVWTEDILNALLQPLFLASVRARGTTAIHHIAFVCSTIRSDSIKLPNSFQHRHPTQSWLHCWGLVIDTQTLAAINHAQTACWTERIMWFHDIHPEIWAWKDRNNPNKMKQNQCGGALIIRWFLNKSCYAKSSNICNYVRFSWPGRPLLKCV